MALEERELRLIRSRTSRLTGQALADKLTAKLRKVMQYYNDGTISARHALDYFIDHCDQYTKYCDEHCPDVDYFQQWLAELPEEIRKQVISMATKAEIARKNGGSVQYVFRNNETARIVDDHLIRALQRFQR
jgi:hypothetical protein